MWREDREDLITGLILFVILSFVINFNEIFLKNDTEKTWSGTSQYSEEAEKVIPANGNDLTMQEQQKQETQSSSEPSYELTPEERDLVERVVMGLAEHEDTKTQKAIAQCILNACRITNERPDDVIKNLRYTKYRPSPSKKVKQSVSAIFDDGEMILEETVIYLYNYLKETSHWHEEQKYILTIGSFKFFE